MRYSVAPLFVSSSLRVVIWGVFLSLVLSACATVFNPGPPPVRLQLNPVLPVAFMDKPLDKQLTVAMPSAGRDFSGDGVTLIFSGREIRYLAGARWANRTPYTIQRGIMAALGAANILAGTSDEMDGAAADARLLTDVRQFGLRYADAQSIPVAVFSVSCRLLDLFSGRIRSIKNVDVEVLAKGKDFSALAQGCEDALGQGLAEIVRWLATAMRTPDKETREH